MASNERRMPTKPMRQEHESLLIKDPSIFPIMQLPIEVRQKVWKSVMVFEEPISVRPHGRIQSAPSHLRSGKQVKIHIIEQEQQRLSSQFALASTCRQVYLEVAPVYYGLNTFTVLSKYLVHFLRAIGAENVRSITLIRWTLAKLDISWIPTISLHLDDTRLPGLRSLRVCLEMLSERRTRAPFCSSEFKEVLESYPWLGRDLSEHQGRFCYVCAVSLRHDMNQLLGESTNLPSLQSLSVTDQQPVALQHLLDLKTVTQAS